MRFLLSFWYIGIFYLYEHELQVPIHDQRETMYTDRDREREGTLHSILGPLY